MNGFDKIYYDEMSVLGEGRVRSLVGAGLVGLGALGASGSPQSYHTGPSKTSNVDQIRHRISDDTILKQTSHYTKRFEGYRSYAYIDDVGVPTIGYGSNLTEPHILKDLEKLGYDVHSLKDRTSTISKGDAVKMLNRGLIVAIQDAKRFVTNWDSLEISARIILVDMSYQMGLSRLQGFKNFKAALEGLDYKTAKAEMIDSDWYHQSGRRSRYLVDLMDSIADRVGER